MRVTAATKEETRQRIVAAAVERFKAQGFDAATTRDIARQAGIATGTLFNYFRSKEAIVLALTADSLLGAADDFARRKRHGASLEEDLFLYVACGLRRLKRHRAYMSAFIQSAFSPLLTAGGAAEIDVIRVSHLEQVQEILANHDLPEVSPVAIQLYWTLYLGILAYWIADRSRKQEQSLVLVDQSVSMFCDWLHRERGDQTPAELRP